MGVSYSCHAIVGVKLEIKDVRKTVSEPVYEYQNRYDVKTGEVVGTEKVLLKPAVYNWVIGSLELEDLWDIIYTNLPGNMKAIVDKTNVYIGYNLKVSDFGRMDCPKTELSLEQIQKMFEDARINLKEIGLNQDVNFYIFPIFN